MKNEDSDVTLLIDEQNGESIPQINGPCNDQEVPFLVVSNGFEKGKKILLMTSISSIGRSSECIVSIKDNMVSSKHAEIIQDCPNIFIRDVGSKNGTFVNGRRRREAPLSDGDRIMIGSTEMVITIPPKS